MYDEKLVKEFIKKYRQSRRKSEKLAEIRTGKFKEGNKKKALVLVVNINTLHQELNVLASQLELCEKRAKKGAPVSNLKFVN